MNLLITKATNKMKNLIRGLLAVSEGESIIVTAENVRSGKQADSLYGGSYRSS